MESNPLLSEHRMLTSTVCQRQSAISVVMDEKIQLELLELPCNHMQISIEVASILYPKPY